MSDAETGHLNTKQQAFVAEYLKDFNATQAAIRAGYSKKTAQEQGSRLLSNVMVSRAIKQHVAERVMRADEVLVRLADIARGSLESFLTNGAIDIENARTVGTLHLLKRFSTSEKYGDEIEIHDPLRALELLGKANGALSTDIKSKILDNLDFSKLTTKQVQALANGEDVFDVLLNP